MPSLNFPTVSCNTGIELCMRVQDFFKMEDPVHAFEDDALGDFSGRGAVDIGRGAKVIEST